MAFPVQNIRDVCEERNTTLAEIERKLKIGNGVIAKWEKGKRYPSMDKIEAIADLLKVPVSRLTGEKQKPAPLDGDGLSELDRKLFEYIPKLSYDQKMMLLAQIETVLKAQEGRKEP